MDWRRVAAIVAVVGVHATALVLLTRPTGTIQHYRFPRRGSTADALRIRLIDAPPPPSAIPVLKLSAERTMSNGARKPVAPTHSRAMVPAAKRTSSARRRLVLTLPSDWTRRQGEQRLRVPMRHLAVRKRAAPRLPGSAEPVAGAPVFAMSDPRFRGIAGIVRIIQSLLGGVNAHCVDVDTWRGMTREERWRRHISMREVNRTARDYGCTDPRRGQIPPDPSAH